MTILAISRGIYDAIEDNTLYPKEDIYRSTKSTTSCLATKRKTSHFFVFVFSRHKDSTTYPKSGMIVPQHHLIASAARNICVNDPPRSWQSAVHFFSPHPVRLRLPVRIASHHIKLSTFRIQPETKRKTRKKLPHLLSPLRCTALADRVTASATKLFLDSVADDIAHINQFVTNLN